MIRVAIGDSFRENGDIKESWINQQVNARKKDGLNVCVKVDIKTDKINIGLVTPQCSVARGVKSQISPEEARIVDFWEKQRMNTNDFRGGNLIAFLKQLDLI